MGKIDLNQIARGIYASQPDALTDRPVMGAVIGSRATLIVEAGASPTHAAQFHSALDELTGPPARYTAVTHWHWDHVFGIGELGLPTIAQRETRRRVEEMARLDWRNAAIDARVAAGEEIPFIAEHVKVEMTEEQRRKLVIVPPDVVYDERLEVDLGGLTCRMMHVGGDHSSDSSVIYIPEEGVVFLGDCLYNGFAGEVLFYTPGLLFPLLACLEDLPARYYLPAHHPQPWTRDEFMARASLLRRIGGLVEQTGGDRPSALARLTQVTGGEIDAETLEDLDAFLAGKKMQP